MKRLFAATSALILLAPSLSVAQQDERHGQGQGARPEQGQSARPAPGAGARPGGGGPARAGEARPGPGVGNGAPPGGGGYHPGYGGGAERPAPGVGGYRPNPGSGGERPFSGGGQRPGSGGAGPYRPGVNRPGNGFYYSGRYRPRYRAGEFRYPPGFGYRRWNDGQFLPRLFLDEAYFFADWAALGLDPPPYGYQWVRYGPDLLLVELGTGRIADVIYDAVY